MEDEGSILTVGEVKMQTAETSGAINPADSTLKVCSTELSPDSTTEIKNPLSQVERLESFEEINKVNGDCNVECSVSSPSPNLSGNNNNNHASSCNISDLSSSCRETSLALEAEESAKFDDQKNDNLTSESELVPAGFRNQSKNLNYSSQQKSEHSLHNSEETVREQESSQFMNISNVNEVTSTLVEKTICEEREMVCATVKSEIKSATIKAKKISADYSPLSCNKNDSFKMPRHDLKSSTSKPKPIDSTSENPKANDVSSKVTDNTIRNVKRKCEDKHLNTTSDLDLNDTEKFPIQYKGFKKKTNISSQMIEKRLNLRCNPFNPACNSNRKSNKCVPSRLPVGDEIDCSSLQQSEYAQYLGLQPILKFRCSNCGSSAFQSMVALNTHQIECTKSARGKLDKIPQTLPSPIIEPKSTNIKLTRKVFLCSACGTYYEHWNLFLHMREVHRRYICLYCLGMFSIAEKLSEHLIQKHKITNQNFSNLEDFQKHSYQTFFMLCLTCDKVFSEMDDFYGHVCVTHKKSIDGNDAANKAESTSSQECNPVPNTETCSNTGNRPIPRRTRETSKRSAISAKTSQIKKEEIIVGNVPKSEDNASSENKEEVAKSCDIIPNKTSEIGSINSNENVHVEQSASINNEADLKSSSEHEIKVPEPQSNIESSVLQEKIRPIKKTKSIPKKVSNKRKKLKEKEEENDSSTAKIRKILDDEPKRDASIPVTDEIESVTPNPESENNLQVKDESINTEFPTQQSSEQVSNADIVQEERKEETGKILEINKSDDIQEISSEVNKEDIKVAEYSTEELTTNETCKNELPTCSVNAKPLESKNKLQTNLLKFKLPGIDSDGESDDSQKLSLVVDENVVSDAEIKVSIKIGENNVVDSDVPELSTAELEKENDINPSHSEGVIPDITLASEDVAVMALTLDDKIENIPIQTVLKECVRTSCTSCNYCRHAVKIAVNGKQLALHILSEHRYMPIKNETPDDVINKLKTSLTTLQTMFFNTETYDSSDPSIHVPYDQDSSFDCFQCSYVTTTHRDLFAHKRKSHTKSLLLCIMCKSNFYSYSELLCHLCPGTYNAEVQFHNVDINFRCCFCRIDTIPSAFRLMVHLRKTHHTCDICLENGGDQQKLSTHMWKHKLNHLCYRCGIAYASKPDITKHLFWKHGHESVLCKKCLQKKWPHVYHFCIPPNSFICEECNTSFSKAVALKVHKRIHGNDFPYSCTDCSKKFVSKKLLQRHEERHIAIKNNIEQKQREVGQKEERKEAMINVSDVINENKATTAHFSDSKEVEQKDKSQKKHKKDKDKKDKQVVDVYDLPPLNLSSESDSSDEDNNVNDNSSFPVRNIGDTFAKGEDNHEKITNLENKDIGNAFIFPSNEIFTSEVHTENIESKVTTFDSNNPQSACDTIEGITDNDKNDNLTQKDNVESEILTTNVLQNENEDVTTVIKCEEQADHSMEKVSSNEDAINNKKVEDIWKNFYSTNPQNNNLPYPLCGIKSEIALGIIMGDHDYCHQPIEPSTFREENPSTSELSVPLINDQLEEITEAPQEKESDLPVNKDTGSGASPVSSPKKKPKSPKKKNSKGENENNSSSSSDSSSDSSSSSCSCGPNCSCSSSSSNSSSSSSSDSESSAGEEGMKQERKRKKRERRSKTKSDHEPEMPKEEVQPEVERSVSLEPIDPPIRESELETDETTTDEEFYDQQPQRIANRLLAEKRSQLMLLASAANVNNGIASPSPVVDVLQPEVVSSPKQKVKTKKKRKVTTKGKASSEKNVSNSHSFSQLLKDNESLTKQGPQYTIPLTTAESKLPQFVAQTPSLMETTTGSGSETEKSRSSKRRRIPNKFYGYSSGEEEDKPTPSPKWKKQETINQPSRVQPPPPHPPTPRIQLTVPKQVIRKPYKFQKSVPKPQPSSSDSTDSGSEMENQRTPQIPVTNQEPPATATSQKNDKDVYCYCRCPYDEVSEMIACDDENCEIEWFHFECVGILVPPRGQWFCPGCRKARGLPT